MSKVVKMEKALAKEIMHPKKLKSQAKKVKKKLRKTLAKEAALEIVGRGDYRPTSMNRVRGRGDYFGDFLGGVGKTLANTAATAISGGLNTILGRGDYFTPRINSLNSRYAAQETPSQAPFAMGAASVKFAGKPPRIEHREFVQSVRIPENPSDFHTTVYRIQPGLSGTDVLFPWGSSVAQCFQQYIMHGMILEYVSTCSDFSATVGLGSVSMSTLYDANADPLASLAEVNNNDFTTTAKPSIGFYHPIECASSQSSTNVRYVRKSNAPLANSDERLDDIGIFQLSTEGLAGDAGTEIGQLWIHYDVEFLKSAMPDLHVGTTAVAVTTSAPQPVDPSMVLNPNNSLNVTLDVPNYKMMLPVGYNGNYLLVVQAHAVDFPFTQLNAIDVQFGTDVTGVQLFADGAGPYHTTAAGAPDSLTADLTNQQYVLALAFSTIAENADQNFLRIFWQNTTGPANWTVIITAMDNDIQPPSLEMLVRRAKRGGTKSVMNAILGLFDEQNKRIERLSREPERFLCVEEKCNEPCASVAVSSASARVRSPLGIRNPK